jgi:hypothetical protein
LQFSLGTAFYLYLFVIVKLDSFSVKPNGRNVVLDAEYSDVFNGHGFGLQQGCRTVVEHNFLSLGKLFIVGQLIHKTKLNIDAKSILSVVLATLPCILRAPLLRTVYLLRI